MKGSVVRELFVPFVLLSLLVKESVWCPRKHFLAGGGRPRNDSHTYRQHFENHRISFERLFGWFAYQKDTTMCARCGVDESCHVLLRLVLSAWRHALLWVYVGVNVALVDFVVCLRVNSAQDRFVLSFRTWTKLKYHRFTTIAKMRRTSICIASWSHCIAVVQ
jgi:hypothetical protein